MKNYTVQKLLDLRFYTEGPAVDDAGNFYFTALTGGFIGRIDPLGISTEWSKGTCPNGQVISQKNGEHLFCESNAGGIARYSGSGECLDFLVKDLCAETKVQSPNDLILDSNENLYFTDSIRTDGKVFFRSAEGREVVVASGIDYANGLALSLDEKFLYVAESYQNRILIIELSEPGVGKGVLEIFAELPRHNSDNATSSLPDGLAVDREGRLWVAHYGMQAIQVLSPAGEFLFTIDTTLPLTSNLHFIEDTDSCKKLLVTGGYGEPGPGAVLRITVYL